MNKIDLLARVAQRIVGMQKALPPGRSQRLLLPDPESRDHPFEERNIHPALPDIVKRLFDDTHYAQSTFEAFKYVDKVVQYISGSSEFGAAMMHQVFGSNPLIKLTHCSTDSEKNEQQGYQFLFAGSVLAIRNPRGHEHSVVDSPDMCLDHLGLASMLLRRLEEAGCVISDGLD